MRTLSADLAQKPEMKSEGKREKKEIRDNNKGKGEK